MLRKEKVSGKFFVTFPYPYMNGLLHCGHLFTLLKADFMARYKDLCGYDVLFPLSFHSSGTPIVSAANRVKKGDEDQIERLIKMGIDDDDISKFTDPKYWPEYFIKEAINDIRSVDICADMSNSFTTVNDKIYEKFITWQFNKLHDMGKLIYAKHPVIYSPNDKQVCAGHDRRVGENAVPRKMYARVVSNGSYNFLASSIDKNCMRVPDGSNITVLVGDNEYLSVMYKKRRVIISKEAYKNIMLQDISSKFSGEINIDITHMKNTVSVNDTRSITFIRCPKVLRGTGIIILPIDNDSDSDDSETIDNFDDHKIDIEYYEPSETVISRNGDPCYVADVDQWFIDYSDKEGISEHIDNMYIHDDFTRKNLHIGNNWIDKWPCSRSYGLGTKLPCDDKFMIDSLSDSTIYMALYTIYDDLKLMNIDDINDDLFDAIFINKTHELHKKFEYWYPVDLRVSAKDLLKNHLLMCLYNHKYIFNGSLPIRYYTNGYLLINGEKMSKSGNFVTIRDIMSEYDSDVVRIGMAMAGDGNDDANLETKNITDAEKFLDKLSNLTSMIITMIDDNHTVTKSIWDDILLNKLSQIYNRMDEHMENMEFRKVMVEIHNLYSLYKEMHDDGHLMSKETMDLYIRSLVPRVSVIAPMWAQNIDRNIDRNIKWEWIRLPDVDKKLLYLNDRYNSVLHMARATMNKKNKSNFTYIVEISVFDKFGTEEQPYLEKIREMYSDNMTMNDIRVELIHKSKTSTQKRVCGSFCREVEINVGKYGYEWLDWVTDMLDDETDMYNYILPDRIHSKVDKVKIINDQPNNAYWNQGPGKPLIRVISA